MAVSFDCFGTLVTADRPAAPWAAVAEELTVRGVDVPEDWEDRYRSSHRDYEPGREAPLDEHVELALASAGVDVDRETARDATLAAFDVPVETRPGAAAALEAARERGPVAVCSNCSVPGLVDRAVDRAALDVDSVVTSVDCGWRKPHEPIFAATAEALGTTVDDLVHVGDDPRTDGGAERAGGTAIVSEEPSLREVARRLRGGPEC